MDQIDKYMLYERGDSRKMQHPQECYLGDQEDNRLQEYCYEAPGLQGNHFTILKLLKVGATFSIKKLYVALLSQLQKYHGSASPFRPTSILDIISSCGWHYLRGQPFFIDFPNMGFRWTHHMYLQQCYRNTGSSILLLPNHKDFVVQDAEVDGVCETYKNLATGGRLGHQLGKNESWEWSYHTLCICHGGHCHLERKEYDQIPKSTEYVRR